MELFKVLGKSNAKKLMTASTGYIDESYALASNHAFTVIQAKKWEDKKNLFSYDWNPWEYGKWSDEIRLWFLSWLIIWKSLKRKMGFFGWMLMIITNILMILKFVI